VRGERSEPSNTGWPVVSDNWFTDYEQNRRLRGLEDDLTALREALA
jgi:hypothetical protein